MANYKEEGLKAAPPDAIAAAVDTFLIKVSWAMLLARLSMT